jgi:hypothetical protein
MCMAKFRCKTLQRNSISSTKNDAEGRTVVRVTAIFVDQAMTSAGIIDKVLALARLLVDHTEGWVMSESWKQDYCSLINTLCLQW